MSRSYHRIMLGKKSMHAHECFAGGFIGVDFLVRENLSGKFPDEWREFNRAYIPAYLRVHPDGSRIAAGLACGNLWTLGRGIAIGDLVLCPDGAGTYRVGEVTGGYYYVVDQTLPHRRRVRWLEQSIARNEMSEGLRSSAGSAGTISNVSGHAEEIERLLAPTGRPVVVTSDPTIEDPAAFAMEEHLEEFLVENWANAGLGKDYEIYEDEGEQIGRQFETDTGPIDILAIRKDRKELLVIELKRGRASDVVVGQILRYMGYVKEELAEEGQAVRGVVIALDDDPKLRRALAMVSDIEFYRYRVDFRLVKG